MTPDSRTHKTSRLHDTMHMIVHITFNSFIVYFCLCSDLDL